MKEDIGFLAKYFLFNVTVFLASWLCCATVLADELPEEDQAAPVKTKIGLKIAYHNQENCVQKLKVIKSTGAVVFAGDPLVAVLDIQNYCQAQFNMGPVPNENEKYEAGKKFVDAFAALQQGIQTGAGQDELNQLLEQCRTTRKAAQAHGVAVDQWKCE